MFCAGLRRAVGVGLTAGFPGDDEQPLREIALCYSAGLTLGCWKSRGFCPEWKTKIRVPVATEGFREGAVLL